VPFEWPRQQLGQTGLEVTAICAGGAPVGSIPQNVGYEVSPERAYAAVNAILDSPVNFFTTPRTSILRRLWARGRQRASSDVLNRVVAMEEVCRRYGVTLRRAALQFSLREPRICSTVVGTASVEHVAELVDEGSKVLPNQLFEELAALAPPPDAWLW
jgi:aryl-alcohol dehydrogenase-like predicted oxidoreductase